MLVPIQTLLTPAVTRPQLSAVGVVVRKTPPWSAKAFTVSKAPFTNVTPRKGQAEVRVRLGEIAKAHKGEKGFKEGLPIIAYYVKKELTGFRAPSAMSPEDYPSRHRRTYNTMEKLKAKYGI